MVGRFSSISLDLSSIFSTTNKTCNEVVEGEKFHTSVDIFQLKCPVYAVFVAKMSKMAFARFGGQV